MKIFDFDFQLLSVPALGLLLTAFLVLLALLLWNGVRMMERPASNERQATKDRLRARPTTCTPSVLEAFDDDSLPEVSGDLSAKRKRLFAPSTQD